MNVSQVARIIAVWMMIVTPGNAQFRDFVGIPNTQNNNWENNLTTCFRRLGGISLWRRRLLMHAADNNFEYGEIENELDALDELNNESKLDYLTRRYEATVANYRTDLETQLDLLFDIFKISAFLSDDQNRRVPALKTYLMTFYQFVPYHNICHGIAVGLYSASIYAANLKINIPEAFTAVFGNQPNNFVNRVFINGMGDSPENQVTVKEALPVLQRLFIAGLFHDIGHPGFSNASLAAIAGHKPANFFTMIVRPNIANANEDQIRHCLFNRDGVTADNWQNLLAFLSDIPTVNQLHRIHSIMENDNLNADEKLDEYRDALEPIVTHILQNVARIGRIDQYRQTGKFCPSAEMVHAMGAYSFLKDKISNEHLASIIQAILNTHAGTHARFGPNAPPMPLEIPNTERIVHVADILGLAAVDMNLRYEMLKQVFFEFLIEKKVNNGALAFLFPSANDLQVANVALGQNANAVLEAYENAFLNSQVTFAKGVKRDAMGADLALNPSFADEQNADNFTSRLNALSGTQGYALANQNWQAVLRTAQAWSGFFDQNWVRSTFRLI